ncbi:hypothetical protein BJ742DRAFT_741294 [Cladochytrium replicatum]|nr:hypothetical protein BJ742DRAFT_741294 [Cladochytrium replicatum]
MDLQPLGNGTTDDGGGLPDGVISAAISPSKPATQNLQRIEAETPVDKILSVRVTDGNKVQYLCAIFFAKNPGFQFGSQEAYWINAEDLENIEPLLQEFIERRAKRGSAGPNHSRSNIDATESRESPARTSQSPIEAKPGPSRLSQKSAPDISTSPMRDDVFDSVTQAENAIFSTSLRSEVELGNVQLTSKEKGQKPAESAKSAKNGVKAGKRRHLGTDHGDHDGSVSDTYQATKKRRCGPARSAKATAHGNGEDADATAQDYSRRTAKVIVGKKEGKAGKVLYKVRWDDGSENWVPIREATPFLSLIEGYEHFLDPTIALAQRAETPVTYNSRSSHTPDDPSPQIADEYEYDRQEERRTLSPHEDELPGDEPAESGPVDAEMLHQRLIDAGGKAHEPVDRSEKSPKEMELYPFGHTPNDAEGAEEAPRNEVGEDITNGMAEKLPSGELSMDAEMTTPANPVYGDDVAMGSVVLDVQSISEHGTRMNAQSLPEATEVFGVPPIANRTDKMGAMELDEVGSLEMIGSSPPFHLGDYSDAVIELVERSASPQRFDEGEHPGSESRKEAKMVPLRRSFEVVIESKKQTKLPTTSSSEVDESDNGDQEDSTSVIGEDEGDEDEADVIVKSRGYKGQRRRIIESSSPVDYNEGHERNDEVGEDSDDDDDGIYLRGDHHTVCSVCNRGKVRKSKKKSEEAALEGDLGELLGCINCAITTHENCLKKTIRVVNGYTCPVCSVSSGKCDFCGEERGVGKGKHERSVLFRCERCGIGAHWTCLSSEYQRRIVTDVFGDDTGDGVPGSAEWFASTWRCVDCRVYSETVELILTYRDMPISEGEPQIKTATIDSVKLAESFKRDYYVKFVGLAYRHCRWVSGAWIERMKSLRIKVRIFWNRVENENSTMVAFSPSRRRVWPKSVSASFNQNYVSVDKILDVSKTKNGSVPGSVLVKWRELPHDLSTWEAWDHGMKEAFEVWKKRNAVVKEHEMMAKTIERSKGTRVFKELTEQPDFIAQGTLKDYQLDGLNWLLYNWSREISCVIADEMGLATLQRVHSRMPFLVVAPSTTLGHWSREFSVWAPHLHVALYNGSAAAKRLIFEHEIDGGRSIKLKWGGVAEEQRLAKCHVVLTSYEILMGEGAVFKTFRFGALVCDEGHRLKNDATKTFTMIRKNIRADHRVVMTGEEEPSKFNDRKKWEAQYDKKYLEHTLTADDIKELHEVECLVPVSMTIMQRELYKAVFMKNIVALKVIGQLSNSGSKSKSNLQVSKLANIMMELRKICVHPFLLPNVEKESQSDQETNDLFIQSSPKLQLLKTMCRQLKAGNHRVLIFTQFKDGLSVLEDFMEVEGYQCCRMVGRMFGSGALHQSYFKDGDTPISERQAMIDKFNAEGSEIFAFLLTTRTGGVGINLMTADTVIIYDADWNPQQDLQAMARAHRIGQTKPVAVYKLFTKNTIEGYIFYQWNTVVLTPQLEKMIEIGKRKLIMDHVVVESMNDEAENKSDLTSVLKFAAEKLFNEETGDATEPRIIYDEPSVKKLLDLRQDTSGADGEKAVDGAKENGAGSFSFARVWTLDGSSPIDNTEAEKLMEEINLAAAAVREELNSANDEADLLEVLKRVGPVEEDDSELLVVAGKRLRKRAPIQYAENQRQPKRKKLADTPVSVSESAIRDSPGSDWEVSHDPNEVVESSSDEVSVESDRSREADGVPATKMKPQQTTAQPLQSARSGNGDNQSVANNVDVETKVQAILPLCWVCFQLYHRLDRCPKLWDPSVRESLKQQLHGLPHSVKRTNRLHLLECIDRMQIDRGNPIPIVGTLKIRNRPVSVALAAESTTTARPAAHTAESAIKHNQRIGAAIGNQTAVPHRQQETAAAPINLLGRPTKHLRNEQSALPNSSGFQVNTSYQGTTAAPTDRIGRPPKQPQLDALPNSPSFQLKPQPNATGIHSNQSSGLPYSSALQVKNQGAALQYMYPTQQAIPAPLPQNVPRQTTQQTTLVRPVVMQERSSVDPLQQTTSTANTASTIQHAHSIGPAGQQAGFRPSTVQDALPARPAIVPSNGVPSAKPVRQAKPSLQQAPLHVHATHFGQQLPGSQPAPEQSSLTPIGLLQDPSNTIMTAAAQRLSSRTGRMHDNAAYQLMQQISNTPRRLSQQQLRPVDLSQQTNPLLGTMFLPVTNDALSNGLFSVLSNQPGVLPYLTIAPTTVSPGVSLGAFNTTQNPQNGSGGGEQRPQP